MNNQSQLEDYARVQDLLAFLTENWRDQPPLDVLAERASLTPDGVQRLFSRWAGLTPKMFLQAITLDSAKARLADSASILDASLDVGLSGPGRLHDLFVTHEGMTPGQWKMKGEGLAISHGFHPSPFGLALVMVTEFGLCGLAFADEGKEAATLKDMTSRWPRASFHENSAATAPLAARIFSPKDWKDGAPLRITFIGTDFEIRVWETLLRIPVGKATSYGDIASSIGKPGAARAVGAAVGRNPISFVVPCHRVLGKSGDMTGYHWGLGRKRAILGWETGKVSG